MSLAVRRALSSMLALAALSGCSPAAMVLASPQPVAATVDGHPITMASYQARLAVSRARDPFAGIPEAMPSPAPSARLEDFTIEQLIREEIIREEAAAQGISISDRQLSTRITQLRESAGASTFDAALQRNGFTLGSFRDYERGLLLEVALLRAMAHQRIEAAAKALKSGASYEAVAAAWNDDQGTAARHGQVGWLAPSTLPEPALRDAVQSLPTGADSDIVQTNRGLVIARVLQRRQDQVQLAVILVLAPSIEVFSPQGTPAWFTKLIDDRESTLKNDGKITISVGSHQAG